MSYRDEEELHRLYVDQRLDQCEIAEKYNVTQSCISKWINKHDICRPLKDKEYLKQKYHKEGMTLSEIAEEIGCWKGSVGKAMDRFEIKRRDKLNTPTIRSNSYGHEYISSGGESVYIHRLLAVAEYGIENTKNKDIHHTNEIPWDNRPSNIKPLTKEQHSIKHLPKRDENGKFTN